MIAQHIADTLIDETTQPSLEDNALLNERKLFTASIKLAIKDAEHLYSLGKRNPLVLRHKDFQGETQDLVDYFEQQSMEARHQDSGWKKKKKVFPHYQWWMARA